MKLRPYQNEAIKQIEAEWATHKSTLCVLPTGSGKTVMFSEIIRRNFPRRALVLAHRKELVYQARDKIASMTGWRVDVEMGDARADMSCMFGGPRVVVSTVQTQSSGGDGSGRMTRFDPRLFGILVCDEAHHSPSPQWKKVIKWYTDGNPSLKVLGVTATPDRADEEALGQVYESVAYDYEIADAINDGWLLPVDQQMIHVEGLDFSSCRTTAGDLNGADLAKVMEYEENLHRIVSPSIAIIGKKPTIVFSASVNHAERLAEMFNRHREGMAAWVCGETPPDERARINKDFRSGRIQVVCNCGIYTEGADFPAVSVVVMARPTKSRSLYAQMAGRALRPADSIAYELNNHESSDARRGLIEASEKPSALIVDLAGNSGKHKLCTTIDILGGNISDKVASIVRKNLEDGQAKRISEAIAEAEEEERKKKEAEIARRARLTATAKFSVQNINPFNIFDIKPVAVKGWDRGQKLSESQENILRKQGINPEGMPYGQAKQVLNEIFKRWDKNLCSIKQANMLKKRGVNVSNLSREDASKMIDAIAIKEGWKK